MARTLSSGLEIVTVGTGSCVPDLRRGGPCTLVRAGGAAIVVDLGLGALHGLLRLGLRHADVDALFITHLHPDHTAEMASFLFAANYDDRRRTRPLLLAGGPGFRAFVHALEGAHGSWLEAKAYRRDVQELRVGEEFRIGVLSVCCGPANHIPSSLAFRFEAAGAVAVVSGDTGPSPDLEAFAAGADLLLLEVGNAGREGEAASERHLTPRQAGEAARRAGARALVLHHLPPGAGTAAREASDAFGAPAVEARDGQGFGLARGSLRSLTIPLAPLS